MIKYHYNTTYTLHTQTRMTGSFDGGFDILQEGTAAFRLLYTIPRSADTRGLLY